MEKNMQMEKEGSMKIDVQNGGPFLPDDIVREILSRLPVKSFFRYMCVSKNLKSLISHRSFKKLHHQRSLNNNPPSLLVLHYSRQDLNGVVLTTLDLHDGEVLQQWNVPNSSLNIRMLPIPSQSKLVCFVDRKRFLLCHPGTRELLYLPDPYSNPLLVLDYYAYGFGYVPSKDEYMIVHFSVNPNSPLLDINWSCVIRTFSISDDDTELQYNGLRSLEATLPTIPFMCLRPEGVFVCGTFYWMMCDRYYRISLLSFHTENKVFSTVRLPMRIFMHLEHDSSGYESLLEIKDELYFTSTVLSEPKTLQMWKLSDVMNQLWTQTCIIDLQSFFYKYIPLQQKKFEEEVLIYWRTYLPYHKDPNNILGEMRKLRILDTAIYAPKSCGLEVS